MIRRFLFVPILLAAGALVALLTALGPQPEAQEVETVLPGVQAMRVSIGARRVTVEAEGVVRPARRTTVAAEVAGRIVWAAPGLRAGIRIEEGTPLFRIEPVAHEQAVAQARSVRDEAALRVGTEEARARVAASQWADEGIEPDPLALREPQLGAARSALAAAEAALRRAEADLARTGIAAPHAGIVGVRAAEVGEWATPGTPLVELLAVDRAEMRVSLPDAALNLVELPFAGAPSHAAPRVRLTPVLGPGVGAATWVWEGRLVRVEGEMDPATRFLPAIVEVQDPWAPGPDGRPPLLAGLFLRAEIEGREFPEVAEVPASALREDGSVLVVDDANRVEVRGVESFATSGEEGVLIRSGLRDGDRVVTNPPAIVTDGMAVRVTMETVPERGR